MPIFEFGGTSQDTTTTRMSYFQRYSNGILKLSPEGENLVSFLPDWQQGGTNIRNLQETLGVEFERVLRDVRSVQAQLYVTTATWGLGLWEEMLGLPVQEDLTTAGLVRRRTLILTALARDLFTSEKYFQAGLAALAGVTPNEVIITPQNPRSSPYTWHVQAPISYLERDPTLPDPITTVIPLPYIEVESVGNDRVLSIVGAAAGTFQFTVPTFGTTAPIAYNVNAAGLTAALSAIGVIPDGVVTGSASTSFLIPFNSDTGVWGSYDVDDLESAGNVPAGSYTYKFTYVFTTGETAPSDATSVVVATVPLKGTIRITGVPVSGEGAIARKVYRKEALDAEWSLVGTLTNDFDTIFNDTAVSGTTAAPTTSSARTQQATLLEKFIRDTKPAHLHVTLGGIGFRADISAADEDAV